MFFSADSEVAEDPVGVGFGVESGVCLWVEWVHLKYFPQSKQRLQLELKILNSCVEIQAIFANTLASIRERVLHMLSMPVERDHDMLHIQLRVSSSMNEGCLFCEFYVQHW